MGSFGGRFGGRFDLKASIVQTIQQSVPKARAIIKRGLAHLVIETQYSSLSLLLISIHDSTLTYLKLVTSHVGKIKLLLNPKHFNIQSGLFTSRSIKSNMSQVTFKKSIKHK